MSPLASVILRWLARLSALFFACVFLVTVVREFLAPQSGPPSGLVDWLGIVLLLIAVAGMVLAWRWGLAGALIALAALVLHISLVRDRTYAVIWLAAIPAVLYLADWLLRRPRTPARTTTP
ncbi:MAG TPA: hypothetical protein VGE89_09350 [Bryobacteraceae bacterium]|jgi:hypothetical protein